MSDFKIITKVIAGVPVLPPQPTDPSEYFGEQSNDLELNAVNDLSLLSGVDKLRQDLNKILLTESGANPEFDLYGTDLHAIVGGKVNFDVIRAKIRDNIETALSVFLALNQDNPNDDEVPQTFESLSVEQLESDKFEVRVSVITRSGKRVTTDTIVID